MKKIIYGGIDFAKQSLRFSVAGRGGELPNDNQGHQRFLRLLGALEASSAEARVHLILEASGGYEKALMGKLHQGGYLLSLLQPGRVRHFAKAKNQLAKTDRIDAEVLVAFGQAMAPAPTLAPSAAQSRLCELVRRRAQLVEMRTMELNRAEHYRDKLLSQQRSQLLKAFERQIARLDQAIGEQIAAEPQMSARVERLQQVAGVGPVVAATLQAEMPELGTLSEREAAALAGLAPYNRDSGPYQGTRRIAGGRTPVRCALYMAALSGTRHDPILRAFYTRLLSAGKKPLVALTAAMRKLIILLNRLLKNPNFQLARQK